MSALQSVVRSTTIKCEEHLTSQWFSALSSTWRRYTKSALSLIAECLIFCGCCLLQNCYLKANIFYCIIYWIQKLLQNEWTTLICLAVRWVLARSGHSWPVGSWTLIYDDKTFVPRKYCELCCTGRCWPSGRGKMKVEKLQIIEKLQKHS